MFYFHPSGIAVLLAVTLLWLGGVASGDQPPGSSESGQPAAVDGQLVSTAAADASAMAAKMAQRQAEWHETGWPLIEQFCLDCHNEDNREADFDLSPFENLAHAQEYPDLWNRALQMIRFEAMPPETYDVPDEEERRRLGDAIDHAVFDIVCSLRPKAGRVTARRLNRAEYENTVRDLFGMSFNVTDEFPSDEVGAGFDNNADILAMSPMLFEKYIGAAESIARQVVLDPATLKKTTMEMGGEAIAVTGESFTESFYGRIFPKESVAWVEFEVPLPGVYRIQVNGGASNKEPGKQSFAVYDAAGQPIHSHTFDHYDSNGNRNTSFNHEFAAGTTRLLIVAIDQLPEQTSQLEPFPVSEVLTDAALAEGREQFERSLKITRNIDMSKTSLLLRRVTVSGPQDFPAEALPPTQEMIVKRVASRRNNQYVEVERAARLCLEPLIERAFRGPVDEETLGRYTGLVKSATDRGASFHGGLQEAITAILVSPQFLFRVELPEADAEPDESGEVPLSDFQLASRLSYFLWASMPDDQLLAVAQAGELRKPEVLRREVDRMLADPKASAMGDQFAAQWLGLRNLDGISRDEGAFPGFTPELVQSMTTETERLFTHVLTNNRPVGELLDADYTFIDPLLAEHYGMSYPAEPADQVFRRASLEGVARRGVLTHASVLTLTSMPTRTSPVLRGKWILESVMGTIAPDPPPNTPELSAGGESTAHLSVREQLAIHRANPACASCHRVMDQLGFGFEDFDAVGRYRGGPEFDASGELPGGRSFDGGVELARTLRNSESELFAKTVTDKLFAFALGRELYPSDRCFTEQIISQTQAGDYPLADLVHQVVASRPFQYFQVETGASHDAK